MWFKKLYPLISKLIEKIPPFMGKVVTWCLIVFMCCNVFVSCLALIRYDERDRKIAASSAWQTYFDEHYGDSRMEKIYPNAKVSKNSSIDR